MCQVAISKLNGLLLLSLHALSYCGEKTLLLTAVRHNALVQNSLASKSNDRPHGGITRDQPQAFTAILHGCTMLTSLLHNLRW